MTDKELLELAADAGLTLMSITSPEQFIAARKRFATLVAAAEREECAKVCEKQDGEHDWVYAAAIRARGETK